MFLSSLLFKASCRNPRKGGGVGKIITKGVFENMDYREWRRETEEIIRKRAIEYLKPDRSGKGYICPVCGSGSGPKGTGMTSKDGNIHFTCWAGCFTNADIFEIIGKQYGQSDFNEQFKRACEEFGMSYENNDLLANTNSKFNMALKMQSNPVRVAEDYTDFYSRAAANLAKTNYHRGLTEKTLKKFKVGYVEEWRHPKFSDKAPVSRRLIIPIWSGGYLARAVDSNVAKDFQKLRVGEVKLFNLDALKQNQQPVYVVEGEIDALSIIDAGGQALALCSTSNWKKLIEIVKAQPPEMPLIITLDNDKAGKGSIENLAEGFNKINFFSYRHYSLPESYKDANEFLMSDRNGFMEWVEAGKFLDFEAVKEEAAERKQEASEAFEREAVSYHLNDFLMKVKHNREGVAISTGFKNLDEMLDGGFYPGLYVLGANSSIGKTSLLLQIADNIAKAGHGVLYFSMEMSSDELISKSLSRLSLIKSMELFHSKDYAKTTRGVLLGRYNSQEGAILAKSVQEYHEYGERLHIMEGIGDIGIEEIKAKTDEFLEYMGKPPVIVIDYMQIIAPYSDKMTDKQNTDKNVVELKRLSRDYGIPIFGISSFNRESYRAPVSMASFKESGAIEYTSDVLIGLQYYGWDWKEKEKENERIMRLNGISKQMSMLAKQGSFQPIQAKILKNRNGVKGDLFFEFFPKFNYFREAMNTPNEE